MIEAPRQPQDTAPNADQLTFVQAAANSLQNPEALRTAAETTRDVAGYAVSGWDQARQPGNAATITGAADFVEGAGGALVPHAEETLQRGKDATQGRISDWASNRLGNAAETHDGTIRGWVYRRLNGLRETLSNPDNLKRAVGCATLIKAGVEVFQDFDRTRTA